MFNNCFWLVLPRNNKIGTLWVLVLMRLCYLISDDIYGHIYSWFVADRTHTWVIYISYNYVVHLLTSHGLMWLWSINKRKPHFGIIQELYRTTSDQRHQLKWIVSARKLLDIGIWSFYLQYLYLHTMLPQQSGTLKHLLPTRHNSSIVHLNLLNYKSSTWWR